MDWIQKLKIVSSAFSYLKMKLMKKKRFHLEKFNSKYCSNPYNTGG